MANQIKQNQRLSVLLKIFDMKMQQVCHFVSRPRLSEIDNNVHKRPLLGKSKQAKSVACLVFQMN